MSSGKPQILAVKITIEILKIFLDNAVAVKDVLNNVGMYDSSWLVVHAISSVIGILGVCVVIDLLRRFIFEKVVLHFRR